MKASLLSLLIPLVVILSSCSKTPIAPPVAAPVPVQSTPVDLTPVEQSVQVVDDRLDEAQRVSAVLSSKLDEVQKSADSAAKKADKAFETGLEAGSAQALELTQSINKLADDLEATRLKSVALADKLNSSSEALKEVSEDLLEVRTDLALVQSENANLRVFLNSANETVSEASARIAKLNAESVAKATELAMERKWKKIWFFSLLSLSSLVVLYVFIRIKSGGLIK